MSAAPDTYVGPAFVRWRSWRVMPFERLGAEPSVWLCASGTRGLPKLWEPRQPLRAACGRFDSTHDAPWPDCECGFYAYRERDEAETHLRSSAEGPNTGQRAARPTDVRGEDRSGRETEAARPRRVQPPIASAAPEARPGERHVASV